MITKHIFERTELRTLQIQCNDNELFLNMVAEEIGELTKNKNELAEKLAYAEHGLRVALSSIE